MLIFSKELENLRKNRYFVPWTYRNTICFVVVTVIFILSNSMLESLGFGSGRQFSDAANAVLNSFWAGGLSVFSIHIIVWIEMAVRRFLR